MEKICNTYYIDLQNQKNDKINFRVVVWELKNGKRYVKEVIGYVAKTSHLNEMIVKKERLTYWLNQNTKISVRFFKYL